MESMVADEQIFKIVISSSATETVITRRYMKLQDSLASLGGIYKVFEIGGGFILWLIPFGGIHMFMALHLFSFTHENPKHLGEKKTSHFQRPAKLSLHLSVTTRSVLSSLEDDIHSRKKVRKPYLSKIEEKEERKKENLNNKVSSDKTSPSGGDRERLDSVKEEELDFQVAMKCCELSSKDSTVINFKKSKKRSSFGSCGTKRKPKRRLATENRFTFSRDFKEYCDMKKKKMSISLNPLNLLSNKENRDIFFKKMNALKKANKKIKQSLDIITILEKFQDLEKIKCILFNKEQLDLFGLISKPEIPVSEENETCNTERRFRKFEHRKMEELSDDHFLDLIVYYNQIKKNGLHDDIDGRLIRMLDEDMKTYFEI